MRRLVNAMQDIEAAGIGDSSMNEFFLEVFSRLRNVEDMATSLRNKLDALDDLVTDRYNTLEINKHKSVSNG